MPGMWEWESGDVIMPTKVGPKHSILGLANSLYMKSFKQYLNEL